jgi:hypothetical protein
VKTHFFSAHLRAALCAVAIFSAIGASHVAAQAPARPDKIMTIDELRACMKLKQANETAAASILQNQQMFTQDQSAVKTEQAEVNTINEAIRARSAVLVTERDAISALAAELSAKVESAKTDAEKASFETERARFNERTSAHQKNTDAFNAMQQTQRDRVAALNPRIDVINERSKTINDQVAPHQKQVATWRDQCGNRRFREEEELVVKKEMAAGK